MEQSLCYNDETMPNITIKRNVKFKALFNCISHKFETAVDLLVAGICDLHNHKLATQILYVSPFIFTLWILIEYFKGL